MLGCRSGNLGLQSSNVDAASARNPSIPELLTAKAYILKPFMRRLWMPRLETAAALGAGDC